MKPSLVHHLGTVALVAMMAVGCSKFPTEPVVGETGATSSLQSGEAASATVSLAYPSLGGDEPVSTIIDGPPVAVATFKGKDGGQLSVGDFRLVVPPKAFHGVATLTMEQRYPSKPVVELTIKPAPMNNFQKPVTLIVDISRVSPSKLAGLGMSGFDSQTGVWKQTPGAKVDLETKTMSIPLWHFSKYRVEVGGQLGW